MTSKNLIIIQMNEPINSSNTDRTRAVDPVRAVINHDFLDKFSFSRAGRANDEDGGTYSPIEGILQSTFYLVFLFAQVH